MGERERLIARIRQVRRLAKAHDTTQSPRADPRQDRLQVLEGRVEHLESLIQSLQDSVHRESSRQAKRITELETRIQPSALGRALSEDARERGL
jgi:TolA-binding protein